MHPGVCKHTDYHPPLWESKAGQHVSQCGLQGSFEVTGYCRFLTSSLFDAHNQPIPIFRGGCLRNMGFFARASVAAGSSSVCVKERRTVSPIDAEPTAPLQVCSGFFLLFLMFFNSIRCSKRRREDPHSSLPICLYTLIVFCGAFYFLRVLTPHLEDKLLFFIPPQAVTMAIPFFFPRLKKRV